MVRFRPVPAPKPATFAPPTRVLVPTRVMVAVEGLASHTGVWLAPSPVMVASSSVMVAVAFAATVTRRWLPKLLPVTITGSVPVTVNTLVAELNVQPMPVAGGGSKDKLMMLVIVAGSLTHTEVTGVVGLLSYVK